MKKFSIALLAAFLYSPLSQSSQLLVKGSWAPAKDCKWITPSTTMTKLPANGACGFPKIVGKGQPAGTKIPGLVVGHLPPGEIQVTLSGYLYGTAEANSGVILRVTDGTNFSNTCETFAASSPYVVSPTCVFSYTNSKSLRNATLQVQAMASGNGGFPIGGIQNDGLVNMPPVGFEMMVIHFEVAR